MSNYFKNKTIGTPQESGYNDISYDPFDLIDNKSAFTIRQSNMDVFTRLNVYKGVEVYEGQVIEEGKILSDKNTGLIDRAVQGLTGFGKLYSIRVHIPAVHASLGNPCDIGKTELLNDEKGKKQIQNLIRMHPSCLYYQTVHEPPVVGSIVKVRFAKSPSGGKAIQGEVIETIYNDIPQNLCKPLKDLINGSFDPNALRPNLNQVGKFASQPINQEALNNDVVFAYPFIDTTARITSDFGPRDRPCENCSENHKGLDIGWGGTEGNSVLAAADGVVEEIVRASPTAGDYIVINNSLGGAPSNQYKTRYLHLKQINVSENDNVYKGQIIGYNGGSKGQSYSGVSQNPHLHFEVIKNGTQIDPLTVIGYAGMDLATEANLATGIPVGTAGTVSNEQPADYFAPEPTVESVLFTTP